MENLNQQYNPQANLVSEYDATISPFLQEETKMKSATGYDNLFQTVLQDSSFKYDPLDKIYTPTERIIDNYARKRRAEGTIQKKYGLSDSDMGVIRWQSDNFMKWRNQGYQMNPDDMTKAMHSYTLDNVAFNNISNNFNYFNNRSDDDPYVRLTNNYMYSMNDLSQDDLNKWYESLSELQKYQLSVQGFDSAEKVKVALQGHELALSIDNDEEEKAVSVLGEGFKTGAASAIGAFQISKNPLIAAIAFGVGTIAGIGLEAADQAGVEFAEKLNFGVKNLRNTLFNTTVGSIAGAVDFAGTMVSYPTTAAYNVITGKDTSIEDNIINKAFNVPASMITAVNQNFLQSDLKELELTDLERVIYEGIPQTAGSVLGFMTLGSALGKIPGMSKEVLKFDNTFMNKVFSASKAELTLRTIMSMGEANDVYENAIGEGIDQYRAMEGALGSMGSNWALLTATGAMPGKVTKATTKTLKKLPIMQKIGAIGMDSAMEAMEEVSQLLISDMSNMYTGFQEERSENQAYLQSAFYGAIGGTMGSSLEFFNVKGSINNTWDTVIVGQPEGNTQKIIEKKNEFKEQGQSEFEARANTLDWLVENDVDGTIPNQIYRHMLIYHGRDFQEGYESFTKYYEKVEQEAKRTLGDDASKSEIEDKTYTLLNEQYAKDSIYYLSNFEQKETLNKADYKTMNTTKKLLYEHEYKTNKESRTVLQNVANAVITDVNPRGYFSYDEAGALSKVKYAIEQGNKGNTVTALRKEKFRGESFKTEQINAWQRGQNGQTYVDGTHLGMMNDQISALKTDSKNLSNSTPSYIKKYNEDNNMNKDNWDYLHKNNKIDTGDYLEIIRRMEETSYSDEINDAIEMSNDVDGFYSDFFKNDGNMEQGYLEYEQLKNKYSEKFDGDINAFEKTLNRWKKHINPKALKLFENYEQLYKDYTDKKGQEELETAQQQADKINKQNEKAKEVLQETKNETKQIEENNKQLIKEGKEKAKKETAELDKKIQKQKQVTAEKKPRSEVTDAEYNDSIYDNQKREVAQVTKENDRVKINTTVSKQKVDPKIKKKYNIKDKSDVIKSDYDMKKELGTYNNNQFQNEINHVMDNQKDVNDFVVAYVPGESDAGYKIIPVKTSEGMTVEDAKELMYDEMSWYGEPEYKIINRPDVNKKTIDANPEHQTILDEQFRNEQNMRKDEKNKGYVNSSDSKLDNDLDSMIEKNEQSKPINQLEKSNRKVEEKANENKKIVTDANDIESSLLQQGQNMVGNELRALEVQKKLLQDQMNEETEWRNKQTLEYRIAEIDKQIEMLKDTTIKKVEDLENLVEGKVKEVTMETEVKNKTELENRKKEVELDIRRNILSKPVKMPERLQDIVDKQKKIIKTTTKIGIDKWNSYENELEVKVEPEFFEQLNTQFSEHADLIDYNEDTATAIYKMHERIEYKDQELHNKLQNELDGINKQLEGKEEVKVKPSLKIAGAKELIKLIKQQQETAKKKVDQNNRIIKHEKEKQNTIVEETTVKDETVKDEYRIAKEKQDKAIDDLNKFETETINNIKSRAKEAIDNRKDIRKGLVDKRFTKKYPYQIVINAQFDLKQLIRDKKLKPKDARITQTEKQSERDEYTLKLKPELFKENKEMFLKDGELIKEDNEKGLYRIKAKEDIIEEDFKVTNQIRKIRDEINKIEDVLLDIEGLSLEESIKVLREQDHDWLMKFGVGTELKNLQKAMQDASLDVYKKSREVTKKENREFEEMYDSNEGITAQTIEPTLDEDADDLLIKNEVETALKKPKMYRETDEQSIKELESIYKLYEKKYKETKDAFSYEGMISYQKLIEKAREKVPIKTLDKEIKKQQEQLTKEIDDLKTIDRVLQKEETKLTDRTIKNLKSRFKDGMETARKEISNILKDDKKETEYNREDYMKLLKDTVKKIKRDFGLTDKDIKILQTAEDKKFGKFRIKTTAERTMINDLLRDLIPEGKTNAGYEKYRMQDVIKFYKQENIDTLYETLKEANYNMAKMKEMEDIHDIKQVNKFIEENNLKDEYATHVKESNDIDNQRNQNFKDQQEKGQAKFKLNIQRHAAAKSETITKYEKTKQELNHLKEKFNAWKDRVFKRSDIAKNITIEDMERMKSEIENKEQFLKQVKQRQDKITELENELEQKSRDLFDRNKIAEDYTFDELDNLRNEIDRRTKELNEMEDISKTDFTEWDNIINQAKEIERLEKQKVEERQQIKDEIGDSIEEQIREEATIVDEKKDALDRELEEGIPFEMTEQELQDLKQEIINDRETMLAQNEPISQTAQAIDNSIPNQTHRPIQDIVTNNIVEDRTAYNEFENQTETDAMQKASQIHTDNTLRNIKTKSKDTEGFIDKMKNWWNENMSQFGVDKVKNALITSAANAYKLKNNQNAQQTRMLVRQIFGDMNGEQLVAFSKYLQLRASFEDYHHKGITKFPNMKNLGLDTAGITDIQFLISELQRMDSMIRNDEFLSKKLELFDDASDKTRAKLIAKKFEVHGVDYSLRLNRTNYYKNEIERELERYQNDKEWYTESGKLKGFVDIFEKHGSIEEMNTNIVDLFAASQFAAKNEIAQLEFVEEVQTKDRKRKFITDLENKLQTAKQEIYTDINNRTNPMATKRMDSIIDNLLKDTDIPQADKDLLNNYLNNPTDWKSIDGNIFETLQRINRDYKMAKSNQIASIAKDGNFDLYSDYQQVISNLKDGTQNYEDREFRQFINHLNSDRNQVEGKNESNHVIKAFGLENDLESVYMEYGRKYIQNDNLINLMSENGNYVITDEFGNELSFNQSMEKIGKIGSIYLSDHADAETLTKMFLNQLMANDGNEGYFLQNIRDGNFMILDKDTAKVINEIVTPVKQKNNLFNKMTKIFKQSVLMNLENFPRFSTNAAATDIWRTMITNPRVFMQMPKAMKYVMQKQYGDKFGIKSKLKPSEQAKLDTYWEVFNTVFSGGQLQFNMRGIGETELDALFKEIEHAQANLTGEQVKKPDVGGVLAQKYNKYMKIVGDISQNRESVLRFAYMIDQMQRIEQGKSLDYGAANREEVDKILQESKNLPPDRRAEGQMRAIALLANQNYINYNESSKFTAKMASGPLPFLSFQEGNMKLHTRYARNIGNQIFGQGSSMVDRAKGVGNATRGLMLMSGLAQTIWNMAIRHLGLGPEDEEIPEYLKHLSYDLPNGFNVEGYTLMPGGFILNRANSTLDLMEYTPFYEDKQMSDMLDPMKWAKQWTHKGISMANPMFKAPLEFAQGVDYYGAEPVAIDDQWTDLQHASQKVFSLVGLSRTAKNTINVLNGVPTDYYSSDRSGDELASIAWSYIGQTTDNALRKVQSNEETSYKSILSKQFQFKRDKGHPDTGRAVGGETTEEQKLKDAIVKGFKFGDYEYRQKHLAQFIQMQQDKGKSDKEIQNQIIATLRSNLSMFGRISKKDRKEFLTEYLNETEKEMVKEAIEYEKRMLGEWYDLIYK